MPGTDPPLRSHSICISLWMMTIGFLVCAVGCAPRSDDRTSRETVRVDYLREVRPLLETQCYACHGPMDVPSGKLRLDERTRMIEGGRSGVPAIIPGRGAESPLVIAISGGDDERWRPMPPRGHGLRPEQIRLIRLWIDQGASFETD
jgi:hypothetical protein